MMLFIYFSLYLKNVEWLLLFPVLIYFVQYMIACQREVNKIGEQRTIRKNYPGGLYVLLFINKHITTSDRIDPKCSEFMIKQLCSFHQLITFLHGHSPGTN